jgi:hypothetical protein
MTLPFRYRSECDSVKLDRTLLVSIRLVYTQHNYKTYSHSAELHMRVEHKTASG